MFTITEHVTEATAIERVGSLFILGNNDAYCIWRRRKRGSIGGEWGVSAFCNATIVIFE